MKFFAVAALLWGSLAAAQGNYSTLPTDFLQTTFPNTPLPQGRPWGTKTSKNCNPYTDYPNTGVIRSYDFTLTKGKKSPDGYEQELFLINGQFPGPLIECNWGDSIQVTVHNKLDEGTSLHWHGLLQKESPWMDGVPGISQCPIPPGGTFTYTFIADLYGTTWYHSHFSAQYAQGLVGPLIIHGPDTVPYDIDLGPVLLSDWYHENYYSIVEKVVNTDINKVIVFSDNNLIQGQNNFNCSNVTPGDKTPCKSNAGIPTFTLTPGKTHRLRLINAGAEGMQKFTVDGHNMTVIAYDFVAIQPYDTQVITLGVGQRADILIKALEKPKPAYMMRSSLGCSLATHPDATAIVSYGKYDVSKGTPNTTAWPAWTYSVANTCKNDDLALTVPWYPIKPDPTPAKTQEIDINFVQNATGFWTWTMNNSSFRANYNEPILLLSNLGNNSYPASPQWNVYNFGSSSSVRFIINNPTGASHPIHLHGHNMFILASGTGTWDGKTIVNPDNPTRRDVHLLEANGYMVMQMTSDNPGAWPLHCHIAWHVSAGLYVTVLERPADIANYKIPSIMAQTCRDWASWTGGNVVDQIDSGL